MMIQERLRKTKSKSRVTECEREERGGVQGLTGADEEINRDSQCVSVYVCVCVCVSV